jgi:hypothetical protein
LSFYFSINISSFSRCSNFALADSKPDFIPSSVVFKKLGSILESLSSAFSFSVKTDLA